MNFLDAWSAGFEPGPAPIHDELSMAAPIGRAIARRSRRVEVDLDAGLRQRGATAVIVHVLDLSVDGFKAATTLQLEAGDDVWLRLPGLEPRAARVVWNEGSVVGCAFAQPLHPAVLEMVIERSRRGG